MFFLIRNILLHIVVFSIFSCGFLKAEEEIVVRLATQSCLLPIYVGQFQQVGATYPAAYVKELQSILAFDCNYNGMTKVVPATGKLAKVQDIDSFSRPCSFVDLRTAGVFYLLKVQINDKELSCKVISVNSQTIKQVDGIVLTGILSKDRVLIHRLSDAIFDVLFQKKGIASSKIIFTKRSPVKDSKGKSSWVSALFESDYDGGNVKELLSDGASIVTPTYQGAYGTDESSALCYVSYKIGQPKIFFVSKKDGQSRRLTPLRGNQMTPALSRDLRYIAFSCDASGTTDLFLQSFHPDTGAVGKPRQIFTSRVSAQASPTFSSDGRKIAFVSGKDGIPKIYMMDIPSEKMTIQDIKPTLISRKCRENSAPSWSPDGKKIAYSARSSGPRQIWIYDVETKEERQLTDGPGDKENPSWASNSQHLIFNLSNKEGSELYLVNIHQPEAVKISAGAGEKYFPIWR